MLSGLQFCLPRTYTHLSVTVVDILTVFAQGRKTNRERDLRGRTILITAAFHFKTVVSLFG